MPTTSPSAALATPASRHAQREDPRRRVDATLGMVFFIGSWTMAFGTIFLTFLIMRQRLGTWPPAGVVLPSLPLATGATLALLGSSALVHAGLRRGRVGKRGWAALWNAGLALGLVFATLQTWLWFDLLAQGRGPRTGLYETLFYGLTWIHALHLAAGLGALAWVSVGILRGRHGPHHISTVSNAAIFWHFVDVVWIAIFLCFFVF